MIIFFLRIHEHIKIAIPPEKLKFVDSVGFRYHFMQSYLFADSEIVKQVIR